jgi:hypothetical protein
VLVIQTHVQALDHAVRLGLVVAGPDVAEFGMTGDEGDEVGALQGLGVRIGPGPVDDLDIEGRRAAAVRVSA